MPFNLTATIKHCIDYDLDLPTDFDTIMKVVRAEFPNWTSTEVIAYAHAVVNYHRAINNYRKGSTS